MSAFDPVMDYFHAKPNAPQAQPPLVRIPVEVIVQPSGASSIAYYSRVPCVGEMVSLGAHYLRVTHVQHDGAGMLAGRVFVDDVAL